MKKIRGRHLNCLVVFLMALILGFSASTAAAGGHVKIAMSDLLKTLDPYQASSRTSLMISYMLYDPLVERDPETGEIKPHLVTAWKVVDDTTWEFTLRPDVKFHNGNPLTAEAVRFTIMDRILNPDQKSPHLSGWSWCEGVDVVNDTTFRLRTKGPYPLVLQRLNVMFPLDPEWTRKTTVEKDPNYLSRHVNGTGPFKLISFQEGSKLLVEKNENYWKNGVPAYDKLTFRFIKEASTRVAELVSGGVDDVLELPTDLISVVSQNKDLKVNELPILRIYFWQFDSIGRAQGTPDALKDPRVRRAVWYAIDRKAIVKNVLGGHATDLDIPINPRQFGAVTDMETPQYDPEKARALLKEAGYPDGFTLTVWGIANEYQMVNEATAGYLEKVGIKVDFKNYSGRWGEFSKLSRAGKADGVTGFGWGSYNLFDPDALWTYFFMMPEGSFNYTDDKELSGWLHEARATMDMERRKALYRKAQARIVDQAYWIPFYIRHAIHGTSKRFHYQLGVDQIPRWQYGYLK